MKEAAILEHVLESKKWRKSSVYFDRLKNIVNTSLSVMKHFFLVCLV
jgi:hypothetical protein